MRFIQFFFEGRPEPVGYDNPKVIALLVLAFALIAGAYGIKVWRSRQKNPVTRTLSRSWSSASLWFGVVALVLVIARTEDVFFIAMRFFWVLWLLALLGYGAMQYRLFRMRHYTVVHTASAADPRAKYLPKKKKH